MITTNPDSEPLFTFQSSRDNVADSTGDDKEDGSNKPGRIPTSYAPRMYITFKGLQPLLYFLSKCFYLPKWNTIIYCKIGCTS